MASSKDTPNSRPVSGSFSKYSHSARPHSHSISLAANNPSHRVNRRKSVNAGASSTAQAAIAAALREQGNASAHAHRRSMSSRKGEAQSMSSRPSMHAYFGLNAPTELPDQEVVEDNSNDEDMAAQKNKNRNRRASEGSHLIKGDKRSGDLRCDTCGKGYKHSSCLTKHMWEHDPAWAFTSKLLISKHQQVQLLEAASVLCNINAEAQVEVEHSLVDPSEASSASPGYSGSSEIHEELSSVETTPPPMSEGYPVPESKRYSASSNGLSRSYRSVHSSSYADSVVSPGFPPQRLSGVSDFRPTTSGTDDGVLAAATAGLNFSNTPRTRPSLAPSDIPPVPPLPQQYQSYNSKSSDSTLTNIYSPLGMHTPAFTQNVSDERHYREGSSERRKDDYLRGNSHGEDDEMFRMDES